MNKGRQAKIKRYCEDTYSTVKDRFETIERYQRFARRFYARHGRTPMPNECGKLQVAKKRRRRMFKKRGGKA